MQEPYKRVLEKRRTQIVEQVRWSRELVAGLEKYGLLSKDDLRYIETEQNSQSRIYAALTRIIANDEPRAFERFRLLLDELGNKAMAESLDFDRQQIRWDFEKEIQATCLPNYIDLLSAQLLDVALTEQDDYIRECLITAAKRRLVDLRNCIRQQQRDRDNFRAGLWEAITGKKLSLSSLSYLAKNSSSLSEIEDCESTRDEMLLKKTKGFVELLRSRVVELRRENESWLETQPNNNNILCKKAPLPVSAKQREIDVDLFANVRSEEVTQVLRANWQIDKQCFDGRTDDEKFVRINKSVFNQILQTLKPFESLKPLNPTHTEDVIGGADDPSVSKLINLLESMESELQLWRNRSHWLSSEVKSFEIEQQLISVALDIPSTNAAEDRKVRLKNILGKIAELTRAKSPTETTEAQDQGVDDETTGQCPKDGKNRRSSANEDLESSRTESETIVDIAGTRSRRMSAPFMRPTQITTALPSVHKHQKNRKSYAYSNSSLDYGIATSTRNGSKATSKFARHSYDLNHLRQRMAEGRSLVVITAEPLAAPTSPKIQRRKASIVGHRSSIDSQTGLL